ncbi:hypothetical protein HKX48_007953 [Thoreauomyces humboldtii]|nr:hypothetical protein HKX48_007953 [Thoreauomyces humboldtii]
MYSFALVDDSNVRHQLDQSINTLVLGRKIWGITEKRVSREHVRFTYDSQTGRIAVQQLGPNDVFVYDTDRVVKKLGVGQEVQLQQGSSVYLLEGILKFAVEVTTDPAAAVAAPKYEGGRSVKRAATTSAVRPVPAKRVRAAGRGPRRAARKRGGYNEGGSSEGEDDSGSEFNVSEADGADEDAEDEKELAALDANQVDSSDDEVVLPLCRYGSKCYRKNPDHFEDFAHPWLDAKAKGSRKDTADIGNPINRSTPGPSNRISASSPTAAASAVALQPAPTSDSAIRRSADTRPPTSSASCDVIQNDIILQVVGSYLSLRDNCILASTSHVMFAKLTRFLPSLKCARSAAIAIWKLRMAEWKRRDEICMLQLRSLQAVIHADAHPLPSGWLPLHFAEAENKRGESWDHVIKSVVLLPMEDGRECVLDGAYIKSNSARYDGGFFQGNIAVRVFHKNGDSVLDRPVPAYQFRESSEIWEEPRQVRLCVKALAQALDVAESTFHTWFMTAFPFLKECFYTKSEDLGPDSLFGDSYGLADVPYISKLVILPDVIAPAADPLEEGVRTSLNALRRVDLSARLWVQLLSIFFRAWMESSIDVSRFSQIYQYIIAHPLIVLSDGIDVDINVDKTRIISFDPNNGTGTMDYGVTGELVTFRFTYNGCTWIFKANFTDDFNCQRMNFADCHIGLIESDGSETDMFSFSLGPYNEFKSDVASDVGQKVDDPYIRVDSRGKNSEDKRTVAVLVALTTTILYGTGYCRTEDEPKWKEMSDPLSK